MKYYFVIMTMYKAIYVVDTPITTISLSKLQKLGIIYYNKYYTHSYLHFQRYFTYNIHFLSFLPEINVIDKM